jgi:pyruvate,orthophosphate dikinase
VRTPEPVAELKKHLAKAYQELERIRQTLERHFKDVQDFEFTIEDGVVYMLQTRNGKRTAMAALKFSMDMFKEKLIDWKTAVMRNPADQLEQLLAPVFDTSEVAKATAIATGLPAGPGAASGRIYLNADRAVTAADKGEKVLLVRVETSPEDLRGMIAAEGILTARGGVSSHAALVARQMGKVCVCGAAGVEVDYQARTVSVDGRTFKEGDWMSIDGTAGKVFAGQVKTAPSEIVAGLLDGERGRQEDREVQELPAADEVVRSGDTHERADQRRHTRADAERARVRRHRHRALPHRAHVLRGQSHRRDARDDPRRRRSRRGRPRWPSCCHTARGLRGHLPRAQGLPGHHRFLDPPLHEFLPQTPEQQQDLAKKLGVNVHQIHSARRAAARVQPDARLPRLPSGIGYPEISEMQARAVFEAAALVQKEGIKVKPEIMIPLVGFKKELDLQIEVVHKAAREVQAEQKVKLNYLVGTMIEIPRGALTADEIAQSAEFFSFGTNDLTQTGLGMSRDDSGSFLPAYTELEIVKKNPFATIDQTGVGQLVDIAVSKGRQTRPRYQAGDLR